VEKNVEKKIVKIVEKGSGYGLNSKKSGKKNSENSGKRVWLWVKLKKKWKKKCGKKNSEN